MSKLHTILESAHSGLRWVVLLLLLAAIVKMHLGWKQKKLFTSGDKKLALFALMFTHIQIVLGFVLYFISPLVVFSAETMKNSVLRFYTVEHITMMLIAAVLITIGYSKAKRKVNDTAKFKSLAIFYTIGLIIILAAIPWPFRALGGGWF